MTVYGSMGRNAAVACATAAIAAAATLFGAAGDAKASCSSNKPTPIAETWTAAKTKVHGATITIYTGPTDRGAQLQITSGIGKSLWVASTGASAIMKFTTKGESNALCDFRPATPRLKRLPKTERACFSPSGRRRVPAKSPAKEW